MVIIIEHYKINSEFLRLYPKEHMEEMLIRLSSKDRHISQSAHFEVFCYNFFYNKGYKIDLHPIMDNNKRPDFKVYNDKISFYLEATVIKEEKYSKIVNIQNKVITYLKENLTDCKYYMLLNFSKINIDKELKKKKLRDFILNLEKELNNANYSEDIHLFEDSGWTIEISFFAKVDEYSNPEDIINQYFPNFIPKGDYKSVQKSLEKKASKYGKLELPYILAICYYEYAVSLNERDLINALFGNQVYIPEIKKICKEKNGLWYSDKNCNNSKNRTLSGVLYFENFRNDNSFYNVKPKLLMNPWAQNPILLEEIGIKNIDLEIEYVKG